MYIGKISNIAACDVLKKEDIALIEEFLAKHDLKSLSVGKHEMSETNYVSIQEYTTKQPNGGYEAHRKYADVQVIVSGEENIGIADNGTSLGAYNSEKDFEMFAGSGKNIHLSEGGEIDCAVFMPNELHAPCLCVTEPKAVKKAVFKILIND